MNAKICPACKIRPVKKHYNSKWCRACSEKFKRQPKSTLTERQKLWVEARIGKMTVTEMAERLGTSVSNVKRAFRGRSLRFHNGKLKNRPELVSQVMSHYEKHGRVATQKAYPNIKIRSIVERADYYGVKLRPRQTRWTGEQILDAVKLASLISNKRIAKYFNRPNANEGSIRSLWVKRMSAEPRNVHGLPHCMAKHIAELNPQDAIRGRSGWIYPWVVLERDIFDWHPDFMKDAIKCLADFQRKLFRKKRVSSIMKEMRKIQKRGRP